MDPEARYASGWQADLRARCKDFNVPIELKRNSRKISVIVLDVTKPGPLLLS